MVQAKNSTVKGLVLSSFGITFAVKGQDVIFTK